MGDNIRLRGPLGLKQDLYDDKQAKEFKRIFQLTPKEIIAEFEKKEADVKKELDGGLIEPKEYEAKRKQQKKTIPQVQTLKGLKEKIKTYSEFKKSQKRFEEENQQYDFERDKLQEQENYKIFLDKKYGVEVKEGGFMKRIPRKPGQPAGSKKHSDLYTDENPKGTIKGLKFATEEDAKASVIKIKNSGKSKAHKIQAAVAMEQRAGVMGKAGSATTYRRFIDSVKKKAGGGYVDMTKDKKYWKGIL